MRPDVGELLTHAAAAMAAATMIYALACRRFVKKEDRHEGAAHPMD
ncbi:hypothetical protein [Arsenicicoccus dermatophilus]|nr:hypothetical protein [Arsenicicoccus dermatophilus]MCH8613975.1 hypothetical protein [Arsenicicoccus dermatophilus]